MNTDNVTNETIKDFIMTDVRINPNDYGYMLISDGMYCQEAVSYIKARFKDMLNKQEETK